MALKKYNEEGNNQSDKYKLPFYYQAVTQITTASSSLVETRA